MNLPWMTGYQKSVVGVDISSASVKLVELEHHHDAYHLTKFSRCALAEGVMREGEVQDVAAVSEAVLQVKKESKTRCKHAAAAVLGSTVVVKQITMDASLSDADMESQAWVEANKHFPDLINDVNLDFQVLGFNADDPTLADVLLVACRREKINHQSDALSLAGFVPQAVDVDYYAIYRASRLITDQLIDGGDNQSIALLHFGVSSVSLLIIDNHQLIYTKSQLFNASSALNAAKKVLGIKDWLHGFMHTSANLSADQRQELVNIFAPVLVPSIRQLLQFFYSANRHDAVAQVVLAGECALLPELASQVGEQLMLPTIVANPLANVHINAALNEEAIRLIGPAMMLPLGLAMRGLA